MKSFGFAAVVAAAIVASPLASAPAFAQTTADTFTGPRIEVTVGLDQLRFDLAEIGGTGRGRASDLGYGAAIGYDVALNPMIVAGVEAGVELSDTSFTTSTGYLRGRRELTLAGRIGTPIGDNALLYGKLGYANLQVREQDQIGSGTRNLDGLLFGAGAELRITPRTYLTAEYRYTDYAGGYVANNVMTGIGIRF